MTRPSEIGFTPSEQSLIGALEWIGRDTIKSSESSWLCGTLTWKNVTDTECKNEKASEVKWAHKREDP